MLIRIPSPFLICILFLFYSNQLSSQQARMVHNINTFSTTIQSSSQIEYSIEFNNKSIQVQYSEYGNELWEYDGINPPTLIMDINPGSFNGVLSGFIIFNNKLFFAADNGIDGYELWVYDGINLPYMVANLHATESSRPRDFIVYQNKLYFVADSDAVTGLIWVYDDLNAPVHAPNLNLPYNSSITNEFIVFDNQLFCIRYENSTGIELYRYDGINAPILVQNIYQGSGSSVPKDFVIYNNKLFFTAYGSTAGRALWVYDGTQVSLAADINTTSSVNPFVHGEFVVYNNELVFVADDQISGMELWKYDGTQATLIEDLAVGIQGFRPKELTVLNNQLYFSSSVSGFDYLWSYDGSTSSIVNTDILRPTNLSTFQNNLIFQGSYSYYIETNLNWGFGGFIYDASRAPQLIGQKYLTTDASSEIKNLTVYNDMLYFSAKDELNNIKLWSFNGLIDAPNSTRPIQNSYVSYPENLTIHKDKLYFSGQVDNSQSFIWQYDGLNAPNSFSVPFTPNSLGSFCSYEEQLFFQTEDYTTSDFELWNLNDENFTALIDSTVSYKQAAPRDLIVYKDNLYFILDDYFNGEELWKYDGNVITMLTDISPDFSVGTTRNIRNLILFKDKLYFNGWDGNQRSIWSYDGNTPPAIESNATNITGVNNEFIVFQDKLYYIGYEFQTGYELWSYNGIDSSTLVADLSQYPNNNLSNLTILGDKLYFAANSAALGVELWTYDGNTSPLVLTDIAIGPNGSYPNHVTPFNGKLYFAANDGIHGIELWEYTPDTSQQTIIETPNDLKAILYPNPSTGTLNINFEYLCLNPRVQVVKTNGQVVLDKIFSSTDQIQLQLDRANAVYFVRIQSEDGHCSHQKVVMY